MSINKSLNSNSNPFEKPKYETGRRAELGDIVLFEDKLYMLIEKNEDKIKQCKYSQNNGIIKPKFVMKKAV